MPATDSSPHTQPPRWARIADGLCVLLVVLAAIVRASGGFRTQVGGWQIALTSPWRLLLWTAAIVLVRHAVSPASPIYRHVPARLAQLWRHADVRTSLTVFAGTRAVVFLVGYLAVFTIGFDGEPLPNRFSDNELANLQSRWDSGWYLGIARNGYNYRPEEPDAAQEIAFFPAYPMAVRAAGRLGGGAPMAFLLGGTIVSLGAFLGALVYLRRLARDLLGGEDQADWAIWLLASYPFALFFGAVYTEALFLLGAVAAFYHLRRHELWRAAAWGLLVGLTRPNGCLLALPLAVVAITSRLPPWLAGHPAGLSESRRTNASVMQRLLVASTPGVGVVLYSAFIWRVTGDPLAWVSSQRAWGREYRGLWVFVADQYGLIADAGLYGYISRSPFDVLNAVAVVFAAATLWPVARRLGPAYALFVLVNLLPAVMTGGLTSAGRYTSVLFPAFIWLGSALSARQAPAWVASFMALQALNAALFYTWRPLY